MKYSMIVGPFLFGAAVTKYYFMDGRLDLAFVALFIGGLFEIFYYTIYRVTEVEQSKQID